MRAISILISICIILVIGSCSTTPEKPKTIPRHGPHRPINPIPRKIQPNNAKCTGKPTVIAIIDTGFGAGWEGEATARLCKYGHKDFTVDQQFDDLKEFNTVDPVPKDFHGHGTHIAGTIDAFAKSANINYCLVILKYYNPKMNASQNLINTVKAIQYAKNLHAKFINYSGGGLATAPEEIEAVKNFIDNGGTFVTAAGNERADLAEKSYYPAMDDDRTVVVGNLEADGKTPAPSSNYGKRVNRWEIGTNLKIYNHYMTGTSQATAVATGKLVAETKNFCK